LPNPQINELILHASPAYYRPEKHFNSANLTNRIIAVIVPLRKMADH